MNSKFKLSIIMALLIFMPLSGFASGSASEVLVEAKSIYKQADELQGAWRTTDKLIKNADQAMKSGNEKAALKMAKRAKMEAKLSLEQAKEQQKNWSEPNYLK